MSLKKEINKRKDDLLNKRNAIEFNNFFKYSGKQELNNKFVMCSTNFYFSGKEEKLVICNDMSKYKLNNYR